MQLNDLQKDVQFTMNVKNCHGKAILKSESGFKK